MVSPSFSMSEELVDSFEETINELKREGEIDIDTPRSEIVRGMIAEWIEENRTEGLGELPIDE